MTGTRVPAARSRLVARGVTLFPALSPRRITQATDRQTDRQTDRTASDGQRQPARRQQDVRRARHAVDDQAGGAASQAELHRGPGWAVHRARGEGEGKGLRRRGTMYDGLLNRGRHKVN
ncbi:hypothetical protein TEQG_03851 [Trichophyton equinum CBS 127.97]|uniref:Uncharacterized protein n=1 Tax=Trichophyton equinum (strain ATCC MYA-4606 / CBS 127.97) TaxID=559882 RepID=F2PSZ0_TRIEC|nr:hypothetical protein TEQG_03851 [Trichophyton equinum CBS 127.97]